LIFFTRTENRTSATLLSEIDLSQNVARLTLYSGKNRLKINFPADFLKMGRLVMKFNVGRNDRMIRVIVGLAIIWAGFYYEEWWGVIGIIPLVTAAIGYCPAYTPFKFSTHRKDD
jgi:hypothetical protein